MFRLVLVLALILFPGFIETALACGGYGGGASFSYGFSPGYVAAPVYTYQQPQAYYAPAPTYAPAPQYNPCANAQAYYAPQPTYAPTVYQQAPQPIYQAPLAYVPSYSYGIGFGTTRSYSSGHIGGANVVVTQPGLVGRVLGQRARVTVRGGY